MLGELDDSRKFGLIDLSEIKLLIGDLVGACADLALQGRLRSGYREAIERDAIPGF